MNKNQPNTLPPEYFDHVYQANRDPWNFETSPYEREEYAATLAALPRARYAEAFEIGCSLGVLTAQLHALWPPAGRRRERSRPAASTRPLRRLAAG